MAAPPTRDTHIVAFDRNFVNSYDTSFQKKHKHTNMYWHKRTKRAIVMFMETPTSSPALAPESLPALSDEQKQKARDALKTPSFEVFRDEVLKEHVTESESVLASGIEGIDALEAAIDAKDDEILTRKTDAYLRAHGYSTDDPEVPVLRALLKKYSSLAVNPGDWSLGPLNPDGSYDTENSGQALFAKEVEALFGPEGTETAGDPELAAMVTELEGTRQVLAGFSIQRRGRLTRGKSKKSRALQEQYETAQAAYDDAKLKLGKFSVEAMQAAGMSEEEIKNAVFAGSAAERAAFTFAEADAMDQDKSKIGRVVRWMSKHTAGFIGANVVGGFAAGYGINKIAKIGLLTALPGIGIGALIALRTGKSMVTAGVGGRVSLHKQFEKRGAQDQAEFEKQLAEAVEGSTGFDAEQFAQLYQRHVSESVDSRVHKDIRANKQRVAVAAAISGAAALGGAYLAGGFEHHGHAATGTGGGGGTAHESLGDKLQAAGLDPNSDEYKNILAHPEKFKAMTDNPEQWAKFYHGVEHIKASTGFADPSPELAQRVNDTLALSDHLSHAHTTADSVANNINLGEVLSHGSTYTIPRGGGIIHDVIRPFAADHGHSLTSAQETQVWQAVKAKFGNDIFTNLQIGSHGADQWILQPGQGTLRPEVARYMQEQIAAVK